jgi:hypothetical protein
MADITVLQRNRKGTGHVQKAKGIGESAFSRTSHSFPCFMCVLVGDTSGTHGNLLSEGKKDKSRY